nr:porin [Ancylobacter crimeensis]
MVGTAAAADLPVKAKAAEYVKICSTYGAGFYYIPGTDTCLKVGGYIVADTYISGGKTKYRTDGFGSFTDKTDANSYFATRAAVQLDARTQTEYGTLRSYIEARFNYRANDYEGGASKLDLKYAYIQFAGFTFGKATSAFDFWAGDFWYGIDPGNYYSDTTPNLISYTADFGNGFSATVSLEDSYSRSTAETAFGEPTESQTVPDIVANLAYEGTWGAFKVSGAYHSIPDYDSYPVSTDSSGWAALAGVRFDFAETTTLYIEGAYADGASGYLGLVDYIPDVDANGNTVSGWYAGGALQHYWTPTVFTSIVGSYTETDRYAGVDAETVKFSGYNVGANIGWQPVKGLTLVAQYDHLNATYKYTESPITKIESDQDRFTFSAKRAF